MGDWVLGGMLFNSLQFLLFFPAVVALYFALPLRGRQVHLLAASYVFYMAWEPAYALLLLGTSLVDWKLAMWMDAGDARLKNRLLAVSLVQNLGLLFSFKYYNLINHTFTELASQVGVDWPLPDSNLLLPVGVSFYTFQTLSYTIDVWRGRERAEPSFVVFALYVAYFPQLVAGPIERSGRLLPQLNVLHAFDPAMAASGLRLMAWGFFKKCVVADRIDPFADRVFDAPEQYAGPTLVLASVLFGYQVFCDFSGYSDIAIGSARVMGVELMENFAQPNLSRSPSEFWSRWHISLGTWFRDYVYYPMGGSRLGPLRAAANVLIVFALSGLWHGASWTFLLWGLACGCVALADVVTKGLRDRAARITGLARFPRVRTVVQVVTTIGLIYATFPLFRAEGLVHAWKVYSRIPLGWGAFFRPGALGFLVEHFDLDMAMVLFAVLLVPLTEALEYAQRNSRESAPAPTWLRWSADYALVLGILLFGRFTQDPFVYFQF